MNTHIDEGAEVGHVGHHALEDHAGLEILEVFHAVLEGGGLELRAWVTAWLVQFLEDVGDRRQAEGLVGEALGVETTAMGQIFLHKASYT